MLICRHPSWTTILPVLIASFKCKSESKKRMRLQIPVDCRNGDMVKLYDLVCGCHPLARFPGPLPSSGRSPIGNDRVEPDPHAVIGISNCVTNKGVAWPGATRVRSLGAE